MARLARLAVAGWPHLVLQEALAGLAVFRDEADRRQFLVLLGESARESRCAIHAWALGDCEVRLLLTPAKDGSLSALMQAVGRRYGLYFNRKYQRRGTLWAGRFRATVIEPARHMLSAMHFVELMPPEPGQMPSPWPWSSAAHHVGQRSDPLVTDHDVYWRLGNTPFEREAVFRRGLDEGLSHREQQAFDEALRKGWPLGSTQFLAALGESTERRLAPLKRGRPRKVEPITQN